MEEHWATNPKMRVRISPGAPHIMQPYGNNNKRNCRIHGTNCEVGQEIMTNIIKNRERQRAKKEIRKELENVRLLSNEDGS